MPSRSLEDLHPTVAEKVRHPTNAAWIEGVEVLVTSALRTFDEQAELFAIGCSKPGEIVTNAKPGESWHNFRLAFDVVPLVNGKAVWDNPFGTASESLGNKWD